MTNRPLRRAGRGRMRELLTMLLTAIAAAMRAKLGADRALVAARTTRQWKAIAQCLTGRLQPDSFRPSGTGGVRLQEMSRNRLLPRTCPCQRSNALFMHFL